MRESLFRGKSDGEMWFEGIAFPHDREKVVKELSELSPTEDFALICYEKPSDFCHRHLVANWLNNNGYQCREFQK